MKLVSTLWFRVVLGVVSGLCVGAVLMPAFAQGFERQPFGIERFSIQTTIPQEESQENIEERGFTVVNKPYSYTQAGGHPVALTTTFTFDSEEVPGAVKAGGHPPVVPTQDPKDVVVDIPPGLLGNPTAVPRCSLTLVTNRKQLCSPDTQIGMFRYRFFDGEKEELGPVYNVTPEAGQSAEFVLAGAVNTLLTAHLVRTAQGYGITVVANEIPPAELVEVETTFWGVPAEARYDWMRGLSCLRPSQTTAMCHHSAPGLHEVPLERAGVTPVPFLTLPTDCSAGPEVGRMLSDSWEEPGRAGLNGKYENYVEAVASVPAVTGCELLSFAPGIEVQPDTLLADEPVALGVSLQVPQPEEPRVLATPELRDAVLTLPLGMSISPGIVDGIRACDESGPEGIDFTGAESEEAGLNGELQLAPGHCPDASTVGTAEAITPLLDVPVKGHVYLARPGCGNAALGQRPCTEQDALDGNLYKLYLELGGTGEFAKVGVQIKVPGFVEANPATGQITAKFLNNPQLPFSELRVHLNGGPRAPVDNPAVCGQARTTADFTPWSLPGVTPEGLSVAGTPDALPFSEFTVVGCANPSLLKPGFVAGTVSPRAGRFSSFTLNLTRQDREQYIKGVQVHTPPGLLGILANVPLCEEPAANTGSCPEASRIGTSRVATGAGSHPFEIEGNIYLTGPYQGAPFGLSIVTNAVAGPFNLGLVVVRARINVDPMTSELTVTTDETGRYALPQIVFGVPLRLKRITVNIDRPSFMLNPTNCNQQQVTASIAGSEQAIATLSSPFAAAGCNSLVFKPHFTVSTNGHTTRAKGASLDARLSYPKGALGNDANIARVKVSLPKQLPSFLPTLQKACPAATFDTNPAGCPTGSIVGIAKATTPLLPVGLTGPVYFVSHGGEEFPSLIIILQGDQVRVDLTGSTFINKAGITSSTFKTIPDVPVNTFELYLPQGKYHALAANANLCKTRAKLKMPTEFVAQNGLVVHQSTSIAVSKCGANTAKHGQSANRGRGR